MQGKLEILDGFYADGDLAGAERRLDEWIREAQKKGEKDVLLTLYNEKEGLYRVTGRAEEACRISDESLLLVQQMGLTGTVHHATTILNAATANRAAGNLQRALELYLQARDLYLDLPEQPDKFYYLATLNNNISQVYQGLGDFRKAEEYLRTALELIGEIDAPGEKAVTGANLAQVLLRLGNLVEAESLSKSALAYYESPAGKGDNHYPSALNARGEVCFYAGKYPEAVSFFRKALEISLRVFGENPETACIRSNLEAAERAAGGMKV